MIEQTLVFKIPDEVEDILEWTENLIEKIVKLGDSSDLKEKISLGYFSVNQEERRLILFLMRETKQKEEKPDDLNWVSIVGCHPIESSFTKNAVLSH